MTIFRLNDYFTSQITIPPCVPQITSVFCSFTCGNLCKREQARASGKNGESQKLSNTGPFF
jgi:hypothetical protein